jgi:hypothetical protein
MIGGYGDLGIGPDGIGDAPGGELVADVPTCLDVLPDGREALVLGDVPGARDLHHSQGDNPWGFQGTCGIVSCENVLRQFGVEVSETEVLTHALSRGLCTIADDPSRSGGTTAFDRAQILSDFGVPAQATNVGSLEELAGFVEGGHGVIAGVNAGVLWDDAGAYDTGQSNHAVVVTAIARDRETGELLGLFINDSGRGVAEDAGRFVDTARFEQCHLGAGGMVVVTDTVKLDTTI